MVPECQAVAARLWLAKGDPTRADAFIADALAVANAEQRCRFLALRSEVAEAAEDWQNALRWLRASHAEKIALVDDRYQAQLARSRARVANTIDDAQRHWLRTELRRAQADVQALAARLDDQQSLLAATAHDINNPLSVVLILGELAANTPESLHESAEAILEAARHMRDLVTRLIGSGDQPDSAPVLSIGANAEDASLVACSLRDAMLLGANLNRADLRDAVLDGSVARCGSMRGVCFRGASAQQVDFRQTDLVDADFRDADLRGALFDGVLVGARLAGARYDAATVWPQGFCPAAGAVLS